MNKVFIVTGGVSGLGLATARRLIASGAKVVLADLNESVGHAVSLELGANSRFRRTNVADESSCQLCVEFAIHEFGGVGGLVNCAGIADGAKVLSRDSLQAVSTFTRVLAVNLAGTFNMIRYSSDVMSKNAPNAGGERGVIINTASVAAFDGQIGQAAYAASKGGIVSMTLPIARELARFGIRVMTIAPGIFETPMLLGLPQEVQDSLGQTVPFPARMGRPDEFAALVMHIVENQMLNGEVIRLDGALRMQPK